MGTASSVPSKFDNNHLIVKKNLSNVVDTSSSFRLDLIDLTFPEYEWNSLIYKKTQTNRDLIMSVIKKKYIFSSFSKNELEELIDVFEPISCQIGTEIVKAGYTGKYM